MPRGLTESQLTALSSRVRAPAYFVALDLDTPVYVWDGVGSVTIIGQTWLGVGEFGIIDGIESDASLKASSISLGLHGVPADAIDSGIMSETRGVKYQGRALTVYLGFVSPDTGVPIIDPTAVWSGVADTIAFKIGSTISVSLTGEHYSSRLRRANGNRMTTQSHNSRYGLTTPDLFFEPQNRLLGVARPSL